MKPALQRLKSLTRFLPLPHETNDPVTGDHLSAGEYLSWRVQGIIRRWTFLGVITGITLVVWSTRNNQALLWWNLAASYMALLIESVVGIAMFSQTRRDAVVIREIRALTKLVAKEVEEVAEEVGEEKTA